jgi:hypothetical protein
MNVGDLVRCAREGVKPTRDGVRRREGGDMGIIVALGTAWHYPKLANVYWFKIGSVVNSYEENELILISRVSLEKTLES